MRSSHRAPFVAALATAATLVMTGCGPAVSGGSSADSPAGSAGAASVSPGPASAVSSTSVTPTATGSTSPSNAQTPSSAPASAGLVTYTFPDGHVSFQHPADWRVELFTAKDSPFVGTATIYDGAGTQQAMIYSGQIADGVTSPVTRTVFESLPVPGLQGQPAPTARYSFYVDRVNDLGTYRMHLTAGAPLPGAGMVLDGIIRTKRGVLLAEVHFVEKPFANDDAAKSWLAGGEGQALKALLLSISYR